MALPRLERLRKTRDIERVFRRSRRLEGELVIIRLHKKPDLPGRLAVIVSKAVARKTVPRTVLRRRIVEWFRARAHIGSRPVDCVVWVKPAAAKASRRALYQDLERALKSSAVI